MKVKVSLYCMIVIIVGIAGCLPSLHPIYTEDTLIFDEGLIGKWLEDDGNIWEFRRTGEKEYEMRISGIEKTLFVAHLVDLEGLIVLDLYPGDNKTLDEIDDFYKVHLIPAHTFMKVELYGSKLQLQFVDTDDIANILNNDPNLLEYEMINEGEDDKKMVLTDTPERLQMFFIEHANEVFDEADDSNFIRIEPLYKDEDLVFDENLLGTWRGEEGEVVDLIQVEEGLYDILHVDKDGTETQCYANLVQLKDIKLLSVFLDLSSVTEKDQYGLHLIPDAFMLVEEIEPELQLYTIEYKDLRELLECNSDFIKQEAIDISSVCFEGIRSD
jgi:hypothetical protein